MDLVALVENDTIKLPTGVHMPDGTPARIVFEPVGGMTLAERYAGLVGITDELPADLAENHDRYLHGQAKAG